MRQLATTELANVSGGNDALLFLGLVGITAAIVGMVVSVPTRQPICTKKITPVNDPITGAYMGDMVDTYCN